VQIVPVTASAEFLFIGWLQAGLHTDMLTLTRAAWRYLDGRNQMDIWGALQYVGTGLSLVAFVVAAILLAYRARLKNRAESSRALLSKNGLRPSPQPRNFSALTFPA